MYTLCCTNNPIVMLLLQCQRLPSYLVRRHDSLVASLVAGHHIRRLSLQVRIVWDYKLLACHYKLWWFTVALNMTFALVIQQASTTLVLGQIAKAIG